MSYTTSRAWLRTSRTMLYDAYWPPFHPTLAYDPVEAVATAHRMGADTIRFGSIGKWALYPSAVMPQHPQLGGRDLLAETIAQAHAVGIRVVGYVPVAHGLPAEVVAARPGWAFVGEDGRQPPGQLHFAAPAVVPVCPFGPYRDDIIAIIREVVFGHDVDGLYLDGPYYGWIFGGVCHCAACRQGYAADTGRDLPRDGAPDRSHADWVAGRLVGLIEDIRAIASERDLPLVFNGCAAEYLHGSWQQRAITAADGFLLEGTRGGIKGVGRGVFLDRLVWNYTHRHTCFPRLSTRELEEEDERSGRIAVAQGAAPIVSYAGRFLLPGADEVPVRRLFADLAAIAPLMKGAEPMPHVAIVGARDLQPTEGWNREHRDGHDRYLYAMSGLLRDVGVQHVVLPREALGDPCLLEYAVVVLTSFGEVSPAEAAALRAYVQGGGGLLVTGVAPVALADLLGAESMTPTMEVAERLAALRWDQVGAPYDVYLEAADGALFGGRHPLGEVVPSRPWPGTAVLAYAVAGDDGARLLPALFERRLGTGTAAWLPAEIELTWAASDGVYRDLARFVGSAVDRISRRSRPCRLAAPRGVFSNLMRGSAGILLHLVDEQPDRASLSCSIDLTAPPGAKLCDAFDGTPLPAERRGDRLVLVGYTFARRACLRLATTLENS